MKDLDKPLEAVAWMYVRHDGAVEYWSRRRFDGALHGSTKTPLTDLNKAQERIDRLEEERDGLIADLELQMAIANEECEHAEVLEANLERRDEFIVNAGLWSEFVDTLPLCRKGDEQ